MSLRLILDPGHGGLATGASAPDGRWHEKEVNLDVCRRVRDWVSIRDGVQTRLTRDADVTVDLASRVGLANSWPADCFVSIHCNAAPSAKARGAQVFCHRSDSDASERLAERIGLGLGHFARIGLWGGLFLHDVAHLGHSLYVLRKTTMPAALVELGFLTNSEDDAALNRAEVRQDLAHGIAVAVLNWRYGDHWPRLRPASGDKIPQPA